MDGAIRAIQQRNLLACEKCPLAHETVNCVIFTVLTVYFVRKRVLTSYFRLKLKAKSARSNLSKTRYATMSLTILLHNIITV